jgi:arabinogalactan endo-1,4-beta-galactosidase
MNGLKVLAFGIILIAIFLSSTRCHDKENESPPDGPAQSIIFGADLSSADQILDKGGVYKDNQVVSSPYKIIKDHGGQLVRLRLWHNPQWTKEVYSPPGEQLYNDLKDVEKGIRLSKEQGLEVLLDFHYSDNWADPGKQEIPEAWRAIEEISVLKDSVYQYTFKTLSYLEGKGLMPEYIQVGNEINCGMFYTNAPAGFPSCNVCTGAQWSRLGEVIGSAIQAIKDVREASPVKTKVVLHVADPKNVEWWFDNITSLGSLKGFDIIGFSYYPLWHRTIGISALSESVAKFKTKYAKSVMILETAYPWTTDHKDSYANQFGSETPLDGFPFSLQGQRDLLQTLSQEVIDGGGIGIIYWEPAWISVPSFKDQWGTGSSWENNTLFDFEGNTTESIDYMNHAYEHQ